MSRSDDAHGSGGLMKVGAGDSLAPTSAEDALWVADPVNQRAPHHWVFTFTVSFLWLAAALRSILNFEGPQLFIVLTLLAVWLLLLLGAPFAERRWAPSFVVYLVAQAAVIFLLLSQSDFSDYFAMLLVVPTMQAMERWRPRQVWPLLAVFGLLVGLGTVGEYHGAALTLAVIYIVVCVFFATYSLAARRAVEARARNEALAVDLREANRRLTEYSHQAERLGAARERQRLARDLHDSVTQTLFSMTLTAQSAQLLLQREPVEVAGQLDQIDELARSALEELDALHAGSTAPVPMEGGLVAALERHCAERKLRDGLAVDLQVDGAEQQSAQAEQALLRIAQEALNNVVKHAGVGEATVRLRLHRPLLLAVEDRGRGFDPARAAGAGLGLTSMKERAAEQGWILSVTGLSGGGTQVVVQELTGEGGE